MVDLHFHLLPGLDDGPASMEESVGLARAAAAEGTGTIVATPHVRSDFFTDPLELPALCREVQAALAAARVPVSVRCGGELGHDMVGRLSQAELETIAQGPPGARWILLETPFERVGEDFHGAAEELRDRGFGVLVAHPERSADAQLDGAVELRRELALGALAQVNAQSLTGDHGAGSRGAALALVRKGLVRVVASDAHGPTRPPALTAARAALRAAGLPDSRAAALTGSAPKGLLARGIPAAEALVA